MGVDLNHYACIAWFFYSVLMDALLPLSRLMKVFLLHLFISVLDAHKKSFTAFNYKCFAILDLKNYVILGVSISLPNFMLKDCNKNEEYLSAFFYLLFQRLRLRFKLC